MYINNLYIYIYIYIYLFIYWKYQIDPNFYDKSNFMINIILMDLRLNIRIWHTAYTRKQQ